MNDTPQTDNLARGNHVVPTEFAQELEMERNHAQEGLARAGLIIAQMQKNADELERERDEARGRASYLGSVKNAMRDDLMEARAEVTRLRVELDKYRGQANRFGAESASEALAALATVRGEKEETK